MNLREPSTAVGAAGLLVAVAGVAVLASRRSTQASFGWFAYAPLSEQQLDGLVVVNGARALGAVLLAVGLVLLALAVGARAGGYRTRPSSRRGVAALGVLTLAAGLAATVLPRTLVAVGGWSAPDPRDAASFSPPVFLPGQVAGAAVALVGVLLLAGVVGARATARG